MSETAMSVIFKTLNKIYLSVAIIIMLFSIIVGYYISVAPANRTNEAYNRAHTIFKDIKAYRERTTNKEREEGIALHYEAERRNLFNKIADSGKPYFSDVQIEEMSNRKIASEQELIHNKQELLFNYDGSLSNLSTDRYNYQIEHFKKTSLFGASFTFICIVGGSYIFLFLFRKWVIWLFIHNK